MTAGRTRVTFLVMCSTHGEGIANTALPLARTLARRLSGDLDVQLLAVVRDGDGAPSAPGDAPIRHLLDRRGTTMLADGASGLHLDDIEVLDRRPPRLVDPASEPALSELAEVALAHALTAERHDVVVATTAPLLALATRLASPSSVVIGLDQRATSTRGSTTSGDRHAGTSDADAIVTPTEADRVWLEAMLAPHASRVITIPAPLPDRPVMTSAITCPVIVTAGHEETGNRFGDVVRAFAPVARRHREWTLRVSGSGPRTGALRRLTRQLDVHDNVEFVHDVPDVCLELSRASALVMGCEVDGMPTAMLDAIASGVPIVAYDGTNGSRALVHHDRNGLLVAHRDVDALSSSLDRLVTDDALRRRLAGGTLDRRSEFAPAAVAAQWRQLIDACLAEREHTPLRVARLVARTAIHAPPIDPTVLTSDDQVALVLDAAVQALDRAGATWFAARDERGGPEIAVSKSDAASFLRELSNGDRPLVVASGSEADRWVPLRTDVHDVADVLAHDLDIWIMGRPYSSAEAARGRSLRIRSWNRSPAGRLTTTIRTRATTTVEPRAIGSTELEVAGRRLPSVTDFSAPWATDVTFPIDAVLTWVDGGDPRWLERKRRRLVEMGADRDDVDVDAGDERYLDLGELRYALRSIHCHAPWVRHVWLVTDDQVPRWLRDETPGLTVVDHRDIFRDPSHLPVFNSHAIEANLHRIEGLSEHFLAVNDDVLLARPSRPDQWFTPAGQTVHHLSPAHLGSDDDEDQSPHMRAGRRVRALLEPRFGRRPHRRMLHTPHPLRRSWVAELEAELGEEFERASAAPFRGGEVSVTSLLYPHWAMLSGRGIVGTGIRTAYLNTGSPDVERYEQVLADESCDVVCLGHSWGHTATPDRLAIVGGFMERLLPVPSPWERAP